jgi:hypothetical protein
MIAQKNVTHLFYTSAALATGALPDSTNTLGIRRIGESLCDASALVAGDQFQVIGYRSDGTIAESPIYNWDNLISKYIVNYSALASQVSDIGYNGTDGDIVATNSGNYLITVGFRDLLKQVGGKRLYKFAEFTAPTTAIKAQVAIGLADSLLKNMSKDAFQRILPKVICSSTPNALYGTKTGQEVTIVKGSQYVTFETDLTYLAAGSLTIVAGDYLRIGTAAGIAGTPVVTSDVYRVIEVINATSVKVDRPVATASGTYNDVAAYEIEVIPKATAEAAAVKWGVRLTGNDSAAPFEPGMYGDNLIMFSVGVSTDFSTTEVRLTTTPKIGQGTYHQLAQLDWELQANGREKYRIAEHLVTGSANISSSDTLTHVRTFNFKDNSTDALGSVAESYMTLMIATDTTADSDLDTVFTQTS